MLGAKDQWNGVQSVLRERVGRVLGELITWNATYLEKEVRCIHIVFSKKILVYKPAFGQTQNSGGHAPLESSARRPKNCRPHSRSAARRLRV